MLKTPIFLYIKMSISIGKEQKWRIAKDYLIIGIFTPVRIKSLIGFVSAEKESGNRFLKVFFSF